MFENSQGRPIWGYRSKKPPGISSKRFLGPPGLPGPQATADEPIEGLIHDPWRSFDCEPNPEGCVATFSDPDHEAGGRSALYAELQARYSAE